MMMMMMNELGVMNSFAQWLPHLTTVEKHIKLITSQEILTPRQNQLGSLNISQSRMSVGFIILNERQTIQAKEASLLTCSKENQPTSFYLQGKGWSWYFWNAKHIVFVQHLQKGNIINGEYYINMLRQFWWAIKTKTPRKTGMEVCCFIRTIPQHPSP